ncbi:MAG: hypothetical protein AAFR75_00870 [Pseudomonadota bacterium]
MTATTEIEPNVTTEQGLRALAEEGHTVEVLCKADPQRKGPSWHGLWLMRTVGNDGQEKILVTARTRLTQNAIKVREFKTATGVISFLVGVGFSQASIPMKNGKKTSHRLVSD